jgi:hypothetical protein
MKLTFRELSTVLAALRLYQGSMDDSAQVTSVLRDIASDDGRIEPLTPDEIDRLCEEMNCCPCLNTPLKDRNETEQGLILAAEELLGQHFDYCDFTVCHDAEVDIVDEGAWVDCQIWVADDDITEED